MDEHSEVSDGDAGQLEVACCLEVDAAEVVLLSEVEVFEVESAKNGARMPESSASLASDGAGELWARHANVRAWKSNL